MRELLWRPATELAELVRSGEVASAELVEASLDAIEELNPQLNAFVHVDADGARRAAAAVEPGDERPFAGVPIAIKDNVAVAGLPLTMASDLYGDFTPGHDAFLVRRLRDAGFVIVGKTNLPEFGILPVSEPRRFGPARNPWDSERTPGGSSGGAAAAVAAGMVPLAHGNDGGGSIRIPAACCGLVGLKPARGRVSRGPEVGENFLVADGVLTRTTAETAALLDVLAGYEPGDASWAPPPAEPFASAPGREPGRLRVAMATTPPIEAPLHPEAERATREAAELLAGLGHEVEEIEPPWSNEDTLDVFTKVFATNIAIGIFFGAQLSGREPGPDTVEPLSLDVWKGVTGYGGLDFPIAELQLQALARQLVAGIWGAHDVLLTPALAERPVPIGEIDSCSDDPWNDFRRSGAFTPYTALFNVTGQPAISLPLFHGDDGLPLGVQLVGPPAREDLLLSLASQLEAERPWADRRPELAGAA